MNIQEDFPMLNNKYVYFDNAATTYKPINVIESINNYYTRYTSNAHRGDYNISFKVNDLIDQSREKVKNLINAKLKEEIIFTSNATDSMNLIVNGFFKYKLKKDDEVILSKSEHASNVLPWLMLKKEIGIIIKYVPLDKNNKVTLQNLNSVITNKTKVISLAQVTNVVGDERDIKSITSLAHSNGIYVVVDAAQSVPHMKVDVQSLNCDFLVFSLHKMCGPTGVGILYGKLGLLKSMVPTKFGGGMNENYTEEVVSLVDVPYRFEAGTLDVAGIIATKEAIEYIEKIGYDNIKRSEKYLRRYLINELKTIPYIKIYNEESESAIVLINIPGVYSGDLGLYLNSKNICVRSGKHCVKMLKDESEIEDTVRISFYFYNTYEEIDYLISVLKDKESIKNFVN